VIGAGTVLKVEQVDFLADAGAKLIVTPNTPRR
jgi:2-dehydro-3-deoxyphosphogalactonate aldolase